MTPARDRGPAAMGAASAGGAGADGVSPYPFPVLVEIRGVTGPARFSRLSDALAALLGSLRALPLDEEQWKYFEELLGPSAVQSVGHRLATYGEVRALAFLDLTPTVVLLYPAERSVSP
ncbi:hypothetical protein [Streptomyces sp. NRRL WC-3742]|uniref:hypothetical protein n=1 Tax=Streptomyces sp. NRRL WC-3742 TaxID=1463934 RepID=UPI00131DD5D5|nr:hypothetical protein [Streptomyces sp. NRRL WC-3742]